MQSRLRSIDVGPDGCKKHTQTLHIGVARRNGRRPSRIVSRVLPQPLMPEVLRQQIQPILEQRTDELEYTDPSHRRVVIYRVELSYGIFSD